MVENLVDERGVMLRRDAIAAGYDDNALKRLVRSEAFVRMRQGAYVRSAIWARADRVDKHLLLCHAVMRQYDDGVALSHASACVKQGGPNWGLDLSDVHVTNMFGKGERHSARIYHHRGSIRVNDVTRADDHWMTAATRTALDTANDAEREAAVCVLDWFLNQGRTSLESYGMAFTMMKEWPDTLGLHRKLQLCDGRSESVGETRSRLLFREQRLPAPELQWNVFHPSGVLAGRVDFAWPRHRLLCEFDGKQKYLQMRRPGETIEAAVLREKRREDLLRELTGWTFIRLIWADLERPQETAARIRRAMAMAA